MLSYVALDGTTVLGTVLILVLMEYALLPVQGRLMRFRLPQS